MEFVRFLAKCQSEPTVSDFESYLAHCVFEKKSGREGDQELTVEIYSATRDQAFERRDEKAARLLYDLANASRWQEGEWEGALR